MDRPSRPPQEDPAAVTKSLDQADNHTTSRLQFRSRHALPAAIEITPEPRSTATPQTRFWIVTAVYVRTDMNRRHNTVSWYAHTRRSPAAFLALAHVLTFARSWVRARRRCRIDRTIKAFTSCIACDKDSSDATFLLDIYSKKNFCVHEIQTLEEFLCAKLRK